LSGCFDFDALTTIKIMAESYPRTWCS